jgi:hypothetical protein
MREESSERGRKIRRGEMKGQLRRREERVHGVRWEWKTERDKNDCEKTQNHTERELTLSLNINPSE